MAVQSHRRCLGTKNDDFPGPEAHCRFMQGIQEASWGILGGLLEAFWRLLGSLGSLVDASERQMLDLYNYQLKFAKIWRSSWRAQIMFFEVENRRKCFPRGDVVKE